MRPTRPACAPVPSLSSAWASFHPTAYARHDRYPCRAMSIGPDRDPTMYTTERIMATGPPRSRPSLYTTERIHDCNYRSNVSTNHPSVDWVIQPPCEQPDYQPCILMNDHYGRYTFPLRHNWFETMATRVDANGHGREMRCHLPRFVNQRNSETVSLSCCLPFASMYS